MCGSCLGRRALSSELLARGFAWSPPLRFALPSVAQVVATTPIGLGRASGLVPNQSGRPPEGVAIGFEPIRRPSEGPPIGFEPKKWPSEGKPGWSRPPTGGTGRRTPEASASRGHRRRWRGARASGEPGHRGSPLSIGERRGYFLPRFARYP